MTMIDDREAREGAIALDGSVLVQAPAGSGKTTLLAQRYLRLLARVDAPERILALTFTRRAAREMRERVSAALQAARAPQAPDALNPRTWELAVGACRHLERLGIDIEQHPSRLRIETIDAFNAWLATQLPLSAGVGASLRLAEDSSYLYDEAAERTLSYDESDPFGTALERVLALDDQRWRPLRKLIAGMLPARERWLPLLAGGLRAAKPLDEAQLGAVRRRFDDDLTLLVSRALAEARDALGAERLAALSRLLAAAARRADRGAALAAWIDAPDTLTAAAGDIDRWRGLISVVLTGKNAIRSRLTKKDGFPARHADQSAMQDLLAELERDPQCVELLGAIRRLPDPAYTDAQWNRVRDVAQVLILAAAQLEQVFRDRGVIDFPAVSMAARRALGTPLEPSDLGLRLDYRLQHILIDEFQDTSGAQLELLRLLTAGWQHGDGRSVFCVGDPMQSIYGFRQAEVRAFLELAEEGVGEVRFDVRRLSSNFRSAAAVLDWVNATFAAVMPDTDQRDRGAIAYRPGEPVNRTPAGANAGVHLTSFVSRDAEAQGIAELVATRTNERPNWRIAILVRARSHARAIAHGLRARGLAFNAVDIEPLRDRAVVRDLIMLARALLHFGDRTAWLAVLRAPWTGLLLADLWLLARAQADLWSALHDDALLDRLTAGGRARCLRLREVLAAAFRIQNDSSFARWIERTWLALGGPACVTAADDLGHARLAFERLRELERIGLPDPSDFADRFADLLARGEAAGNVEIMTIHKAKGLEFDLVIVPALDCSVPHRNERFLLTHEFARANRDGLVMAARPPVGADPDLLFGFLKRQAGESAALEAQRLLYVACTRARSELHLSAVLGADADDAAAETAAQPDAGEPWVPRAGSLLRVLWRSVGSQFRPGRADDAVGTGGDGAPRGGPLIRVPEGWAPLARSDASGFDPGVIDSPVSRVASPVFDWAGETARQVGILVHAELNLLDLERSDEAAVVGREAQFRRWLALRGIPADRLPGAAKRAVEALVAVHRDVRARWILKRGYRQELREYALSGQLGGEVVRAVFDRSFIDEAGVRWVIDYKTSQHSGGGLDEFLDREVERYRAQMQRYALLARRMGPEPVRVGLYFPLMRAWRDWQPGADPIIAEPPY
jgi:ATP-dependent exoDNAse (exonuclease V) beta subunit